MRQHSEVFAQGVYNVQAARAGRSESLVHGRDVVSIAPFNLCDNMLTSQPRFIKVLCDINYPNDAPLLQDISPTKPSHTASVPNFPEQYVYLRLVKAI